MGRRGAAPESRGEQRHVNSMKFLLSIHRVGSLVLAVMVAALCASADDLTPLSDEFDDAGSLSQWQRIYQVEGWGNNALEQLDINTTRPGRLWMVPHTSSWYAEWRGELTFKAVSGDFVITTDVEPRNRAGTGAPGSLYSLAGIMVRTPRSMTRPSQWTPGGQNYVFLSMGAADQPGSYQYEVKTTLNSSSTLYISNGAPSRATIQVARIGPHLLMLRRDAGGAWQVHRRYFRPDMPATLQAGLTVYTDWPLCETVGSAQQNVTVLTNGARLPNGGVVAGARPDLAVAFDYVRFARPVVPPGLAGANLSNSASVSDAQLLAFLGESASPPGGAVEPPEILHVDHAPGQGIGLDIRVQANRSYRLQRSVDLSVWATVASFVSTGPLQQVEDAHPPAGQALYRVVSP